MIKNTYLMFILSCIIILSMTKNLTEVNYAKWFTSRVRTSAGTVGDDETIELLESDESPEIVCMHSLYSFMSANHGIRKAVFRKIVSLVQRKQSFISLGFAEIHHLMRGHEMQHLVMIDKYIFEKHPEFLKTPILRGLEGRFADAIKKLKEFYPKEAMYAKILSDKDSCAVLNRRIFSEAATVATTIAQIKNATFQNFYQREDEAQERIRSLVKLYLNERYSLVPLSTGARDFTQMPELEKDVFTKRIVADLEKKKAEDIYRD